MSNWLGVSSDQYVRMPHAETPAESLWWYTCQPVEAWADDQPAGDAEQVIQAYIKQCGRGRTLPRDFESQLRSWLQDLSRSQQVSPRRRRYWTIPAYALAHKLRTKTFCKRFRELEKIAKKLFPGRVPQHRKRGPLTEETKCAIRSRFKATGDFDAVAREFGIQAFRVGQLCRAEKAELIAERELRQRAQEENETATAPLDEPEIF